MSAEQLKKFNEALDKERISTLCFIHAQYVQYMKWYF